MSAPASTAATASSSRFPSWTFSKHCPKMEWNELSSVRLVPFALQSADDDIDLVMIGLYIEKPPSAATGASSSATINTTGTTEGTATFAVSFEGCPYVDKDPTMSTLLTEVVHEHHKTLAKVGAIAPTLRSIVSSSNEGLPKSRRFVVFSLGPPPTAASDSAKATPEKKAPSGDFGLTIGRTMATIVAAEKKVRAAACFLPQSIVQEESSASVTLAANLSIGFYNHMYSDNRYRTGDNIVPMASDLTRVAIGFAMGLPSSSSSSELTDDELASAIAQGMSMARGVCLTRDIVNAPHNVLNSESLAETAQRIAAESLNGNLTCRILDAAECEARGMGSYLGVARGSETQPQFIHLTYTPPPNTSADGTTKVLGVVGKGLLFDTGGYNIKVNMMELMKFDCGGAAAVLGAARAVSAMEPPHVTVHFIVAACENMINDRAMVPSDILTASNGLTIEVMNTDAEGRLTLADALVYADKEVGCGAIIELSTLTGACMVALGKSVCGMWTHNDALAAELEQASKATGDKLWRMPMVQEYREQLKSNVADLKNLGTPFGGSITAALFLQHFVDESKPFAHLDIAGPVWSEKTGATGFGAKLIVDWLKGQSQSMATAAVTKV